MNSGIDVDVIVVGAGIAIGSPPQNPKHQTLKHQTPRVRANTIFMNSERCKPGCRWVSHD